MNHDDGDGGHGCDDDEKFQNINDSVPELKVASRQTAQKDHKVDFFPKLRKSQALKPLFFVASAFRPVWPGRCI